nr:MAG TPA: hypothetical protein [Bacteriophage sp.]
MKRGTSSSGEGGVYWRFHRPLFVDILQQQKT